jgi:hypothetical protein
MNNGMSQPRNVIMKSDVYFTMKNNQEVLIAALKECAKQLRLLDCPGHAAIAENAIKQATK